MMDSRLLSIYRNSFPNIEFVDEKDFISEDSFDLQIPMGSLMKILRHTLDSFKGVSFPYLIHDNSQALGLKSLFGEPMPDKIMCGIAWKSANKKLGDLKSIPIKKLSPIFNLQKFQFINLQYGDIATDLKCIEDEHDQKIHQIADLDLYDHLDGTLSLINKCDLIITCSNSVAHMAGALDKKTILVLPYETGKFWYWNEVDGHSLCYPSIKIFSQSQQGNWDEVIDRVKIYMENLPFEQ